MSIQGDAANVGAMATNSDALYATALGQVDLDPSIKAILSPIGQAVFATAYQAIENLAGAAIGELGAAVEAGASALIGAKTLAAVEGGVGAASSAVGTAMPLLQAVVGFVLDVVKFYGSAEAAGQEHAANVAHDFLLMQNAPGSGENGLVTPADLFAPLIKPIRAGQAYPFKPSDFAVPARPLGAVLVAITEDRDLDFAPQNFDDDGTTGPTKPMEELERDNTIHGQTAHGGPFSLRQASAYWSDGSDGTAPWHRAGWDKSSHHWSEVLDGPRFDNRDDFWSYGPSSRADYVRKLRQATLTEILGSSEAVDAENNIGIPRERRRIYQLLRRAIGSHSESDLHGSALWSLYMDMLADDFDAGRMTRGYAVYLLTHQYDVRLPGMNATDPELNKDVYTPDGFWPDMPLPRETFDLFVGQILQMIAKWKTVRATKPALMHLVFKKMRGLKLTPTPRMRGLKLTSSSSSSKKTPAEQAALDAFAASLGLPPGSY